MTPPAPWIGSPMKAPTRSGPISRIFSSSARAATQSELLGRQLAAFAEPVRLANVDDAGNRQAALRVHRRHAAEAGARHRAAVIGVRAADDDRALRLAHHVPVAAHRAHHRVVRLRARAREEHVLELRRRHFDEQARELDRGRMGDLEEAVVVRQLEHLRVGRVGELAPAIAEIHAPQARHAVENPAAVGLI